MGLLKGDCLGAAVLEVVELEEGGSSFVVLRSLPSVLLMVDMGESAGIDFRCPPECFRRWSPDAGAAVPGDPEGFEGMFRSEEHRFGADTSNVYITYTTYI